MSNRLIIHVGYPKTASTTIQDSIFYGLHKMGHIKYFGKVSFYSPDINRLSDTIKTDIWTGGKLFNVDRTIRLKPIMVYSEENYLASLFKRDYQYGFLEPPYDTASRIKKYFSYVNCNMEIILTIRNQASLIRSTFAETQYISTKNYGIKKLDEYVDFAVSDRNLYNVWDFYAVYSAFSKIFGSNQVHVLLFEDFLYDKDFFLSAPPVGFSFVSKDYGCKNLYDLSLYKKILFGVFSPVGLIWGVLLSKDGKLANTVLNIFRKTQGIDIETWVKE